MTGRVFVWLTPFDEEYPQAWLERLRRKTLQAPPVLYAAGALELLNQSGVGVVGSRDVSPRGQEIAQEAAERIASLGMTLVSGGARGVDQLSMNAAFQAGGSVVGILAGFACSQAQEIRCATSHLRRADSHVYPL